MKITYSHRTRRNAVMLGLATACIATSFVIGIQSAGDVRPVNLIAAGSTVQTGDMDGNGTVDVQDAIFILEVVQGYRTATPDQLMRDPNKDGELTVVDAIMLLSRIAVE